MLSYATPADIIRYAPFGSRPLINAISLVTSNYTPAQREAVFCILALPALGEGLSIGYVC